MLRPMTQLAGRRCLPCSARSRAGAALAADLTIGIGADVTAIDPHYHNVTPNNNVAAHIFDYLVLRDERQKPIPGLAESLEDRRSADLGVQAAQGRQVPRRQRLHRGRRRRVDRARAAGAEQPVAVHRVHQADQGNDRRRSVHDPLQDGDAVSADADRHDAGRDHLEARRRRRPPRTSTAARPRSAPGRTSSCATPRAIASSSRATTRYWGGKTPWEKVTLRLLPQRCLARRGAARRRRAGDRIRADVRCGEDSRRQAAERVQASSPTA